MIHGKSVDLKIIEKADIELIRKWRNSPEITTGIMVSTSNKKSKRLLYDDLH